MSNKLRSYLSNVNRVVILALTAGGLLIDGYQAADVLCTFAMVVWLWLPQCVKFEAKALKYIHAID